MIVFPISVAAAPIGSLEATPAVIVIGRAEVGEPGLTPTNAEVPAAAAGHGKLDDWAAQCPAATRQSEIIGSRRRMAGLRCGHRDAATRAGTVPRERESAQEMSQQT